MNKKDDMPIGVGCYTNALKALFVLALFFVLTLVACLVAVGVVLVR